MFLWVSNYMPPRMEAGTMVCGIDSHGEIYSHSCQKGQRIKGSE